MILSKRKRKRHNRLGGAIEGKKPRILFMFEPKMHAPGVQTRQTSSCLTLMIDVFCFLMFFTLSIIETKEKQAPPPPRAQCFYVSHFPPLFFPLKKKTVLWEGPETDVKNKIKNVEKMFFFSYNVSFNTCIIQNIT